MQDRINFSDNVIKIPKIGYWRERTKLFPEETGRVAIRKTNGL